MTPALFAGALIAQGALFAAISAWLIYAHARERSQLLDRIMARDLPDFKASQEQPGPRQGRHNPIARARDRHRAAQQSD